MAEDCVASEVFRGKTTGYSRGCRCWKCSTASSVHRMAKYVPRVAKIRTHCPRGHEIAICGRRSNGYCLGCYGEDWFWDQISRKYNLEPEQYGALWIAQNYMCGICSKSLFDSKSICIDHDHDTDVIRGLLCRSCNSLEGWFKRHYAVVLAWQQRGVTV